jgi:hypothetical protein
MDDPVDEFGPLTQLRASLIRRWVAARNRRAEADLKSVPGLWDAVLAYANGSEVTGASMSDYWTLYDQARTLKPREILECGTGVSTVVLAHALKENAAEGAPAGRVTSMEEDESWTRTASENLPAHLADVVDLRHSPKVDGFYRMFRGVQYESFPERAYDFVFSDGPERHSSVNGDKLFDLDLIQVVRRSETPVRALVDNHYLTFYVLQKVFGLDKARYSVSHRLLFFGPATKHDVRHLDRETFTPDLRLFGTTELKLRMAIGKKPSAD